MRPDPDSRRIGPGTPARPILHASSAVDVASAARAALVSHWLVLTRETLPSLAAASGWAVRADHCFQRILLDAAFGGCWYDHVAGRPAYARADAAALARAVALGEDVAAGRADLAWLNARSLGWRAARHRNLRVRCNSAQSAFSPEKDLFGISDLGAAGGIAPASCGTLRDDGPFRAPEFRQE